ncbi:V4R domain-containing protein [Methanocaldococcus infernus]|nr:V4R domain-containing protein [Methanocaldococcus infernus]
MATPMKIIESLKVIDSRAKFMGIKLTMIRNLLEKYRDDKDLLKEVLKALRGSHLYDLVLEACPYLKDLENEILEEELTGHIESKIKKEEPVEGCILEGEVPIFVYMKEYLRKYYFKDNTPKIFYDIGKDYALFLEVKTFEEMENKIKKYFGNMRVESSEPLIIVIENNKECENCKATEPICYFTSGFIAGCLESIADKLYIVNVEEIKCKAKGDEYCSFKAKRVARLA